MATANPPLTALRFTVNVTPAAAAAMGSSTTAIQCVFYLADTALGFQWTIAVNGGGVWQIISTPSSTPGISAGRMYDDGEVQALVAEINRVGIVAWILKEAGDWFDALMKAFFGPKVSGAAIPSAGAVTVGQFQAAVNQALASNIAARDGNGDGVPELMAV